MKKLFFAALVTLSIGFSSFTASADDSISSVKEFNTVNNTSKNVSWKYTDNFHKASMDLKGIKTEFFYTPDGEFLASSQSFDYAKLPQAALKTLASNYAYPSYSLEECIVIENANQETNYYVSLIKSNKKIILQITEDGTVSPISAIKM